MSVRYKTARTADVPTSVVIGPDFGAAAHSVSLSNSFDAEGSTVEFLAAKDSWVDTAATCPIDNNHDGTDLQAENLLKDIYIAWDLSTMIPVNSVTAGTWTVNVKTPNELIGRSMRVFKISNANENWVENDIRCSNRPPADGAALGDFGINVGLSGDITYNLSAGMRARVDERSGVGYCTFLIQMPRTGESVELESADEGTNDISGPRLQYDFI